MIFFYLNHCTSLSWGALRENLRAMKPVACLTTPTRAASVVLNVLFLSCNGMAKRWKL